MVSHVCVCVWQLLELQPQRSSVKPMLISMMVTLSVQPLFTASTASLLQAASYRTSRRFRGLVDSKLVSVKFPSET